MRILLTKDSRIKLFNYLLKKYNLGSYKELAQKMNVPFKTIQNWKYSECYLPEKLIPSEISSEISIIDKKEENWGKILGGKKTYQIILDKYGLEEIKKRQSNGGKNTSKINNRLQNKLELDIENPIFLEFYGVLLGDGWMSKLNYRGKTINLIGISGNGKKDRDFFVYLKKNIAKLFERKAYLKERPKSNSIEINFCHKELLIKMHNELNFPIGQKIDLKIHDKIYNEGYEKMKHVIRGILDTDGCVYFDKTPAGKPYPCLNLTMKAPKLMHQVHDTLISQGFKATLQDRKTHAMQIILKGNKQLNKWINEIGSSNPRNLSKFALVAQLDSAKAS